MTIVALELPEDEGQWPSWLEQQLVGLHLRELVRQLELITGAKRDESAVSANVIGLSEVLGEQFSDVLQYGLAPLSQTQLRQLVQHPRLLLHLQELVFVEGSDYWRTVIRGDSHRLSSNQVVDSVRQAIDNDLGAAKSRGPIKEIERPSSRTSTRWSSSRLLGVLVSLAACALLIIYMWPSKQGQPNGRYFARAGLLESEVTGQPFLRSLANAIEQDWQTAQNPRQFLGELTALRDSCDLLLAADLKQIDPAVAAELKQRCKKWREAFTQALADLNSGQSIDSIQQTTNETVKRLVNALRSLA